MKAQDVLIELPGILADEVLDEEGDVLRSLAERRQTEGQDGQPEIEVLPEVPARDLRLEVLVRGGDDPDVDGDGFRPAHPDDLPFAEGPEELDLGVLGEFADLVEEDRPRVGQLELAGLVGPGVGEGPLDVAEEFALDEVAGHGPAVDDDEGPVLARAGEVDRPGDELLARAALAADEDGAIDAAHLLHELEDGVHPARCPDDVRESVSRSQFGTQRLDLAAKVPDLQDAGDY